MASQEPSCECIMSYIKSFISFQSDYYFTNVDFVRFFKFVRQFFTACFASNSSVIWPPKSNCSIIPEDDNVDILQRQNKKYYTFLKSFRFILIVMPTPYFVTNCSSFLFQYDMLTFVVLEDYRSLITSINCQ